MNSKRQVFVSFVLGAMTIGVLLFVNSAFAVPNAPKNWEKCMGVAMAGKNDCGAQGHQCAGQAKKNRDSKEWVYVPEGTCAKIGGKVAKVMPAAKAKGKKSKKKRSMGSM